MSRARMMRLKQTDQSALSSLLRTMQRGTQGPRVCVLLASSPGAARELCCCHRPSAAEFFFPSTSPFLLSRSIPPGPSRESQLVLRRGEAADDHVPQAWSSRIHQASDLGECPCWGWLRAGCDLCQCSGASHNRILRSRRWAELAHVNGKG